MITYIDLTDNEMALINGGGGDSLGAAMVGGAIAAAAGAAIAGAPITGTVMLAGALVTGTVYEGKQLYNTATTSIAGAYNTFLYDVSSFFYTGHW